MCSSDLEVLAGVFSEIDSDCYIKDHIAGSFRRLTRLDWRGSKEENAKGHSGDDAPPGGGGDGSDPHGEA